MPLKFDSPWDAAVSDMADWTADNSRPTRQEDFFRCCAAALRDLETLLQHRLPERHAEVSADIDVLCGPRSRDADLRGLRFRPWSGPDSTTPSCPNPMRFHVAAIDTLIRDFTTGTTSVTAFERERLGEAVKLSGYLKTVFMREDNL